MSSLAILVYKNEKPQPNAMVTLQGPSGPKSVPSNGAGAVNFSGLQPGKYTVSASHMGVSLGGGYWDLKPGSGGVISIRYPKTPKPDNPADPAAKTASLTVSVFWTGSTTGQPKLANPAFITLTGPSPRNDMAGPEPLTFKNLKPGEYSISARATAEGGTRVSGTGRRRVHVGKNSIQIYLTAPRLPPESLPTGVGTPDETKQRIRELEPEIARMKGELKQQEDVFEEYDRQLKNMPASGDPNSGEGWFKNGIIASRALQERKINELKQEISRKEAILEGHKDVLRNTPGNHGSYPSATQEQRKNKPMPTRLTP